MAPCFYTSIYISIRRVRSLFARIVLAVYLSGAFPGGCAESGASSAGLILAGTKTLLAGIQSSRSSRRARDPAHDDSNRLGGPNDGEESPAQK